MTKEITASYDKWQSVKENQIAHLAGVFDGAGVVALRISKEADYNLGYKIQPILRVAVNSEQDPALKKLIEYSEENNVKFSIIKQRKKFQWTVTDLESIERFLESIDNHLVSNLFRAKLMLNVVLPEIEKGNHLTKEGFYELVGIAEKMREGRADSAKYTQEYFDEEWSFTE